MMDDWPAFTSMAELITAINQQFPTHTIVSLNI